MKYLILISIMVLCGCSSTTKTNLNSKSDTASIMNLIALTEDKAPDGIRGTFQFSIKASGIQRGVIYLNTEDDYRDRRNITVAIHPKVINAFIKKYGESPELYFINKTIEVIGEAQRVKIFFTSNGRMTKKYYFQTHVRVSSLKQIKVLG